MAADVSVQRKEWSLAGGKGSPGRRRQLLWFTAVAVGGLLAVFLVVRGIVEFFVIDYSRPETYRELWGGPSLAGVLAVHSGPGLVILIFAGVYLYRRRRARRRAVSVPGARGGSEGVEH
jgi:hypothetical protein